MSPRAAAFRRQPLHPSIDEAMIERVVRRFYAKVRADRTLGPIFERAIGEDWGPHLRKMCAFWSSIMRLTGRYHGQAAPAHRALDGVAPAHFRIWLGYFRETVEELCEPEAARLFCDKAERIARSLQTAMFGRPGARTAPGAALRVAGAK
ncbi:group III truncated hemoglobin [Pikeienuella sp. HZG-20]|uniref:group III truncated hemoglobin n=1 Tax=Paludibacillus litoralis TaxID=3133267 RepID=UPI0030ED2648